MAHIRCDFRSEVMDMNTSMTVVLPETCEMKDANVVYLLHGLGDNGTGWARYTSVERYARSRDVALIIPEVSRSFYTDMAFGLKYFSYISEELPRLCRRFFGFSSERERTYVMGLSMGGYGALKCSLTYPENYKGCAAFSAVTDIRKSVREANEMRTAEYKAIFGNEIPSSADLYSLLQQQRNCDLPKYYLACGESDTLFPDSTSFSTALKAKNADVYFEHWEGEHNWIFWDKAVENAFKFFFD